MDDSAILRLYLARDEAALDDPFGDDLLRLIFTACHPLLSMEARVALTLRLLGGLTTEEIARAFLVPEPTIVSVVKPGLSPPPAGSRLSPLLFPFLTRIAAST